ncbi:unnamed protein product, partial [Didymodactylos carnosus]
MEFFKLVVASQLEKRLTKEDYYDLKDDQLNVSMNSSTDAALTELNACRKMSISSRHNHEESADISTELSQSGDETSRRESNTSSA